MRLQTKITILLEGEINEMDQKEVESWFAEVFTWVNKHERYGLGVRLRDAKQRWVVNTLQNEKNNL